MPLSPPQGTGPLDPLWPRRPEHPYLAPFRTAENQPVEWDATIDPADEMFHFCLDEADHAFDRALFYYFRSGLLAHSMMAQALDWLEAARGPVGAVLDFASGYGRTTRFLLPRLGAERIWVADIQPGAVEFQRRQFGVQALLSAAEPEDFDPGRPFDAVFALSLFSHLPPRTFQRWLARLFALVGERGCLVFSTLGEEVAPPEHPVPPGGWAFSPRSESEAVAGEDYGTMWVSRGYLDEAIAAACGGEVARRSFPSSLWHLQDLHVVARPPLFDASPLSLRAGPHGVVELLALEQPRHLVASGWAHDPDGHEVEVRVRVGGHPPQAATTGLPREDVASRLRDRRAARSGWHLHWDLASAPLPSDLVTVTALAGGRQLCLHCSTVEGAVVRFGDRPGEELRRAQRDREEIASALGIAGAANAALAQRIAWMRRSRFWRMRNLWFRLTGRGEEIS